MAVLSQKTRSLTIDLLEKCANRKHINKLFYDHEVPQEMLVGDSKLQLMINVFRVLEFQHEYDKLLGIVQGAVKILPPDFRKELERALFRDGFVSSDDGVVPDEVRGQEHKSALEQLVQKHSSKLTAGVLLHHLKEAEDQFRVEKWGASTGDAGNFVEQLLLDIATAISRDRSETPNLSQPRLVRDYLVASNFFDEAERKKLVDGIYGFFSEEGSHPGVSDQSTARVCLIECGLRAFDGRRGIQSLARVRHENPPCFGILDDWDWFL